MPSDDKDPSRKNNIDFREGPKDEKTENFLDWLKQKQKEDDPQKFDNRKQPILNGRYPDRPPREMKKEEVFE